MHCCSAKQILLTCSNIIIYYVGFVVSLAVDGYSRSIFSIRASCDNTALSTYVAFMSGVAKYGCPMMVRTDHGRENTLVWLAMLRARGYDNSVITGDSRHNTRVERMHGVHRTWCMNSYMALFRSFEELGVLDISNDIDLYCLQFMFVDRIQHDLGKHGRSGAIC